MNLSRFVEKIGTFYQMHNVIIFIQGNEPLVQMLIKNGASSDLKLEGREPVLHRVINDGNWLIVEFSRIVYLIFLQLLLTIFFMTKKGMKTF